MIASPIVCDKKQGSLLESLQISVCKLFNIGKLRMLIIISLSLVRGLIPGIQVFLIVMPRLIPIHFNMYLTPLSILVEQLYLLIFLII